MQLGEEFDLEVGEGVTRNTRGFGLADGSSISWGPEKPSWGLPAAAASRAQPRGTQGVGHRQAGPLQATSPRYSSGLYLPIKVIHRKGSTAVFLNLFGWEWLRETSRSFTLKSFRWKIF